MEQQFLDQLPAVFDVVGTPHFEKQMSDAMGSTIDHDFITMVRYSKVGEPCFLIHSHTFPTHAAELYLGEFIYSDPYLYRWRETGQAGIIWLQDIVAGQSRFDRYQRDFLPKIGVSDELGVFLPAVAQDSVAIFYNKRSGQFTGKDKARLQSVFGCCAALYRLHIRTLLSSPEGVAEQSPSLGRPVRITDNTGETVWVTNEWNQQAAPESDLVCMPLDSSFGVHDRFLWTLGPEPGQRLDKTSLSAFDGWCGSVFLTPREKDIVSLIFKGHSGANIARILGLSLGNIKNHKRRIYRKLDITSERELFLMFFGAISE